MKQLMKKSFLLVVVIMSALAMGLAACTPTGGEPESIAGEPTQTADNGSSEVKETDTVSGELSGIRWVLVSYLDETGNTVEALADREVTAEFGEDGRLSGHAGCNNYFAGYTVDGSSLTVSQAGSTMMACEPVEVMEQEARYLANLASAATFAVDGEQLQIVNADGETVLTFRATQPASLVGANWTATSYNTGTQAVSSIMVDTAITAVFTEDGKLNGLAGCNNYMTSYTLDGSTITIQPPATTRKLCPEPAGIMEQEAAFVSMLPQSATYSISGNVLELRTADGALVAAFTTEP